MAIRLRSKTNVDAPDGEYPYGNIVDDDGSENGTPVDKEVYADIHQFFARLMEYAIENAVDGFDWNELPDNAYDGFQYFEALLRVAPYKVYRALLTQSGTSAPVATVLENTIGNVVWSRTGAGHYKGTLNGAFDPAKTHVLANGYASGYGYGFPDGTGNAFLVYSTLKNGTDDDNILTSSAVEVKVYP